MIARWSYFSRATTNSLLRACLLSCRTGLFVSVFMLIMPAAHTDGLHRNLFPWDTSFETGRAGWVCWNNGSPDNWSLDSTTAFHGNTSLKFAWPVKLEAYRFTLEKDHQYSFSCYIKTDKPGARCDVIMFTRAPDGTDAVHGVSSFTCSQSWQRAVAEVPAHSYTTDDWRLMIIPRDDATFWVDAFQLEEGDLTDYTYHESISISTGEPANVYTRNQHNKTFKIGLYNPSQSGSRRVVRYTVVDFNGKAVQNGSSNLLLLPGEHTELAVNLPKDLDNGFYTIAASLNDGDRKLYRSKTSFCIVPVVNPSVDSAKAFFGTADYATEVSEEIFTGLTRIGSKWFNVPFRIGWSDIEPVKGEYHWDTMDKQVAFVKKFGINMVGYIYDFVPKWAASDQVDSRPRDMADFEEFIYRLVSRYKNDIRIWDVLSEADLAVKDAWGTDSVKAYAEFLRAAHQGAHRADPGCVLVGCSVSNGDTSTGYPFTRAVLKELGDDIDGMAPHPYTSPRSFGPSRSAIGPVEYGVPSHLEEAQRLANRKHLWIGEFGYDYHCLPDSSYAGDHAAYMAQTLIIARSMKSIERFLWFTSYYHYWTNVQESYGLWIDDLDPMPAVAAYATAVHLLGDVSARAKLNLGKSVEAYAFSGGGRAVAAVWASAQAGDVSLVIPKTPEIRALNIVGTDITRRLSAGKSIRIKLNKLPVYIVASNMSIEDMQKIISLSRLDTTLPVKAGILVPDSKTVRVVLTNMTKASQNVTLKVNCPLSVQNPLRKMHLKSDEVKTVDLKIIGSSFVGGNDYDISAKIDSGGKSTISSKKFSFMSCPKISHPVSLDGNLDEWSNIKPLAQLGQRDVMPPDAIVHKLWSGNDDLSAVTYLAHDDNNLYLAAKVTDDKHFNTQTGSTIWNGDAIQIGIDSTGLAMASADGARAGYSSNDAEIGFALTSSGEHVYQWFPSVKDPGNTVKCRGKQDGQYTIYEAAVPFTSLPNPSRWRSGMIMGFSLAVLDDDDGSGKKYWMEITPGIVGCKDPSFFRSVILE